MQPSRPSLRLKDAEIIHVETGLYTVSPQETISRAEEAFPRIGVDVVEQVDPAFTDGVPIFRVNEATQRAKCHRVACLWAPPPTPLNNPPRETYGKGMNAEQSKASAIMEAVERYSAQPFPHSNIVSLSPDQAQEHAIPLTEFNSPETPLKCLDCPQRGAFCFSELASVCREWTWGYSLVRGRAVLVPSATVYYPYIAGDGTSFMFNDTGGLSAGNTIEEAILQGMSEVIERDALYSAFNQGNLVSTPMLRIDRPTNDYIDRFLAGALPAENVFAFSIRNATLDLGVPTIAAFVCYEEERGRRYFGGSGTSLNPEAALLRALTELVQQKVRQRVFRTLDPGHLMRHDNSRSTGTVPFADLTDLSTRSIKESIMLLVSRLDAIGSDVVVVDLTHPAVGIPVVRVIVPGLIAYSGGHIKESVFLETMSRWEGFEPS